MSTLTLPSGKTALFALANTITVYEVNTITFPPQAEKYLPKGNVELFAQQTIPLAAGE